MLCLKHPMLVAGIGASLLAGVAALPAIAQNATFQVAQAGPQRAGTTMDVDLFYDQLGQYGTWVQHPDYQYVFIPADVGPGWRPYQEGRWVWTDAYGWYWESYEPFGWATYHYGRWGYDPAYGWFWVPGDTWAPAWVTWRRGGGRTGWAPVAPDRPGYAVGRPDHYAPPVAESWVFVEDRYMAEEDIAVHVAPIPQINVYLQAAPDYYEPRWNDGYYVNSGFGYTVYDEPIRRRLATREVYYVDRRDDIFYDALSNRLGIFAPRLDFRDRRGPPPRYVREIEPDRRPLIRQYVHEERDVPGIFAPSAALLNLLEPDRRRELRDRRFDDPDRFRREVRDLERDRAEKLREERRQADVRADALQRQQREALEKRRAVYEKMRAEQRAKAQKVVDRAEKQPGPRPGGPAANAPRPGGPNDARNPDGDRNRPGNAQRPGTAQDAPRTPGQRPGDRPDARPAEPRDAGGQRQRPNEEARDRQQQQERRQQQDAERQRKQEAQQEQQRAKQQQQEQRQKQRDAERQQNQQKREVQQEQQRVRQQERQQQKQEAQKQRDVQRQQNQQKREAQQEQQRARQQQRQEQRQQQVQQQRQQKPPQARPMPNQPPARQLPPGGGQGGGKPGQPVVPPGAQ